MNNKGLTLVELLVTFALASVIIIMLLNVLVIIKKNYQDTNTKTSLIVNQSTLSNVLNNKFAKGNLASYTSCEGTFCYTFNFRTGESIKLEVTDKKIVFGNYSYVLDDSTNVVNPSITNDIPYLIIKIPIINKKYPNTDFGINLVYKREDW